MSKSKPWLWLVLSFTLLLVVVIALSRFLQPSQPVSTPTPSPTPSTPTLTPTPTPQFLDWRLYQNPKHDYQFKYDPSWSLTDTLPNQPRYDLVLLQQNNQPLIKVSLVHLLITPVTIEELLDYLHTHSQLPMSAFKTTHFGRQQIYSLRVSQTNQTDYYFLHKGLTFKITFYGYSSSQLPSAQLHFLKTFSLL